MPHNDSKSFSPIDDLNDNLQGRGESFCQTGVVERQGVSTLDALTWMRPLECSNRISEFLNQASSSVRSLNTLVITLPSMPPSPRQRLMKFSHSERVDAHSAVVVLETETTGQFKSARVHLYGTETALLEKHGDKWVITHIHWSSRKAHN